ncbi:unnamed protein product, partial [Laminaria digitata]
CRGGGGSHGLLLRGGIVHPFMPTFHLLQKKTINSKNAKHFVQITTTRTYTTVVVLYGIWCAFLANISHVRSIAIYSRSSRSRCCAGYVQHGSKRGNMV